MVLFSLLYNFWLNQVGSCFVFAFLYQELPSIHYHQLSTKLKGFVCLLRATNIMDFNLISPKRVSLSHGRQISAALSAQKRQQSFLRSASTPFMSFVSLPYQSLKERFKTSSIFRRNCCGSVSFYASPWFVFASHFFSENAFLSDIYVAELWQQTISSLRLNSNFSINMRFSPTTWNFFYSFHSNFGGFWNRINIY